MAWRRVVVRPDSIIRFWSLNLADVRVSLRKFIDDPAIEDIRFDRLVAFSDGSELIRTEEFGSFGQHLITASQKRPLLFSEIGKHYEAVGRRWLKFLDRVNEEDLQQLSVSELQSRVKRFVDYYREYAPILWVPFIVERRYAAEYPALVEKVAEVVVKRAEARASGELRLLSRLGGLTLSTGEQLRDAVRGGLEFSPRRTMSEDKESAILDLAAAMESHPAVQELLAKSEVPTPAELERIAPALHTELLETWERYKWISHWGYPSHHRDATPADILLEVRGKMLEGAGRRRAQREADLIEARQVYLGLLRIADLTKDERNLLEDINYFNFLRTYRMEIKIRAQYLSVPLFREIERRGIEAGDLIRDDVFWMVPPEVISYLGTRQVPADLAQRRVAWALPTQVDGQQWSVLTGREYQHFTDEFFSVIGWLDNARGPHNPTVSFVGGKAAGLYRLLEIGVEPPPFFVVTTHGFRRFVEAAALRERIREQLAAFIEPEQAEAISQSIRKAITDAGIPVDVNRAIESAMSELGGVVAVRSSATVEDAQEQSWAGRFESVLHSTPNNLTQSIKQVWASLFSAPALLYAHEHGVNLGDVDMAVIVQRMVTAEVSGVMNTVFDSGRRQVVEIEAAFGYGTAVVNGEVTPDRYLVDTAGIPKLVDEQISAQTRQAGVSGWEGVDPHATDQPKLTRDKLVELATLGKRLEGELGSPQDIEFCIAGGVISIVQSRPQTGLPVEPAIMEGAIQGRVPGSARLAVTGLKGKVAALHEAVAQVLSDLSQGGEFQTGNVLVLQAATPAWDPIIFRASALVTNEGGATSHAIRVSNERGIPAVVGTGVATEVITDGAAVLLDTENDAFKGKVYTL